MQKNVAQKWIVYAWTTATMLPKTGDAANITANVRIDGGASNPVDDTNPTELEGGFYIFDITAAESNGDLIVIVPSSVTAGTQVRGVPEAVWTTIAQTGDSFARIGAPAGASVSADVAAVKADTAATLLDTGTDGVIVATANRATLVDEIWNEVASGHLTPGTAGEALGAPNFGAVVADGANSIISFKTDLASTVDGYCTGSFLKFTTGNCINQVRKISNYGGTSKLLLVTSGFTAIPAVGDTFIIINQ